VVGKIVPNDIQAVCDDFHAGNIANARMAHFKLFALCKDMLTLATNPIPIKAAMKLMGRGNGALRLPLVELEDSSINKLRTTLRDYGLLD
jgi:4-hydroxy-tetrahydrodipicolinate synthase